MTAVLSASCSHFNMHTIACAYMCYDFVTLTFVKESPGLLAGQLWINKEPQEKLKWRGLLLTGSRGTTWQVQGFTLVLWLTLTKVKAGLKPSKRQDLGKTPLLGPMGAVFWGSQAKAG